MRAGEKTFANDAEAAKDVEDSLHVVSKYLLTANGSKALEACTHLSQSTRGLLMERAAARISFQPKFINVDVLGTAEAEAGGGASDVATPSAFFAKAMTLACRSGSAEAALTGGVDASPPGCVHCDPVVIVL